MAGHISLTGKHLLRAEDLLFHTASVLAKMSNNYWLEGGTLLGIIRENRLLPWDNDVDLSFMYNDIEDFEKFITEIKPDKFSLTSIIILILSIWPKGFELNTI